MNRREHRLGIFTSIPIVILLLFTFIAPLIAVFAFSIMPSKVFTLNHIPDFSAYVEFVQQGYWKSLAWSLGLAAIATFLLLIICWPLSYAMVRVFKKFTLIITIAVVMTLFVSENIRLFGWVITLMKGGMIEGYFRSITGHGFDGLLYNVPIIVFGLIYIYLPFMLFPLAQGIAMIPDDVRHAAADMGANRWQIFKEVELPLAAPGIVVGSLLTFVLAAGAVAESKLLGGQAVIVISDDVESAFTYGQNWPLGSALATVLILVISILIVATLKKVDLDKVMSKGK
jgi:spermidine/putrescine transport system permease protein